MTTSHLLRSLALLTALTAGTGRLPGVPTTESGFHLAFEETFDGPSLDSTRWRLRAERTRLTTHRTSVPTGVLVDGRRCLLLEGRVVEPDTNQGYPYVSAGIISKQTFGYGYYEVQARLPNKKGWHCSFWSYQTNVPLGVARGGNEIDGFEVDTIKPTEVAFNLYIHPRSIDQDRERVGSFAYGLERDPAQRRSNHYHLLPSGNDTTAWHTYAWEWKPDEVIWYVDGVEVRRTRYAGPMSETNLWLTNLAINIRLGTGVGGVEDGSLYYVDRFRYWSKDYGATAPRPVEVVSPAVGAGWIPSPIIHNDVGIAGSGSGVQVTFQPGAVAQWAFPPSLPPGGYEVFAFNPTHFALNLVSPDWTVDDDLSDGVVDERRFVTFAVTSDGGVSTTRAVDQVYGGSQWVPLGFHTFTPGVGQGVSLTASAAPMQPTRAGPVAFRPYDLAYDAFSGSALATGWSGGTSDWSVVGGQAVFGGTAEGVLHRNDVALTTNDDVLFVRARIFADGATSLGVMGRRQASGDGYLLRVAPATRELALAKRFNGAWQILPGSAVILPPEIDLAGGCDLMLFLDDFITGGVRLRGFVDGREFIHRVDTTSPLHGGAAGLRVYGGAARLDQFGAGR